MFNKILLCMAAVLLISGCASNEETFATKLKAQGSQYTQTAEKWEEGNAMVKKGQALIEQGKDEVSEGRDLIDEGQDHQDEGREMVRKGELLKAEAEDASRRLNPATY